MDREYISRIVHSAVMAVRKATGQPVKGWDEIPEETRAVYRMGVDFHMELPHGTAQEGHYHWMESMEKMGRKDHPEMVTYEELSDAARAEREVFAAVVEGCKVVPEPEPIVQKTEAQPAKETVLVPIRYKGKRDRYTEGITKKQYSFVKGTKDEIAYMLPEDAEKLLEHPTVFERATKPEKSFGANPIVMKPVKKDEIPQGESTKEPVAPSKLDGQEPVETEDKVPPGEPDIREPKPEEEQKATDGDEKKEEEETEEDRKEVMRMAIQSMDKDAMKEFAKINFAGVKIAANIGEDTLRTKLNTLIDQFGVE